MFQSIILYNFFERLSHYCNSLAKKMYVSNHQKQTIPWFQIQGDKTLRLNYDLNMESLVFDLGGYKGQWASDIFAMYCCQIHIFEPVPDFSIFIEKRFVSNDKISVHKFGLLNKTQNMKITIDGDSSSIYNDGNKVEEVSIREAMDFIHKEHIDEIDLMKINIEGGEYDLLWHLIDSDFIRHIKDIQVQFHEIIPDAKRKMLMIQHELEKTHRLTYQYPFVWENWRLK